MDSVLPRAAFGYFSSGRSGSSTDRSRGRGSFRRCGPRRPNGTRSSTRLAAFSDARLAKCVERDVDLFGRFVPRKQDVKEVESSGESFVFGQFGL